MKRSLFATGAALLMATTAANAASETLLVRGYWKAFVNMTDATTPICGMRTDLSNPAQTQSGSIIVKWFKGQPGLTIQVFKASWSFPEDGMKLPIYVIFDNGQPMLANGRGVNSQLTASGLPTGSFVEIEVAPSFGISFLKMFGSARAMRVGFRSGNEQPWSADMTGSGPVMSAMARCILALGGNSALDGSESNAAPTQPYGTTPTQPYGKPQATQPYSGGSAQPSQPYAGKSQPHSGPATRPTQPVKRPGNKADDGSI